MRLATIDTVTTTQTLRDNLQNLGVFAATVSGNINKIQGKFDKNYSQLIACGATVDNPIGILFNAYSVIPCYNFKQYIKRQHEDYLNGRLTGITHEHDQRDVQVRLPEGEGLVGCQIAQQQEDCCHVGATQHTKGSVEA